MQTNFNVYPPVGVPGQWADDGLHDSVSYPALVAVPFGVLCEVVVSNGIEYCQPVQDAGTEGSFTPKLAGVSLYDPAREQAYQAAVESSGSYAAGEMVPCARRGRVFAQFDGTGTWPTWSAPNVWHSSTGAAAQGVFTMHATQTTAGSEIDTAPAGVIGVDADRAQSSYTDGFGVAIKTAVVSLNLG
jgi:hypothetical protein